MNQKSERRTKMSGEILFIAFPFWKVVKEEKYEQTLEALLEAAVKYDFDFNEFTLGSIKALNENYDITECEECGREFLVWSREDPYEKDRFCDDDCRESYER